MKQTVGELSHKLRDAHTTKAYIEAAITEYANEVPDEIKTNPHINKIMKALDRANYTVNSLLDVIEQFEIN